MSLYDDEDGIDGPFERAMLAAMREDSSRRVRLVVPPAPPPIDAYACPAGRHFWLTEAAAGDCTLCAKDTCGLSR